MGRALSILAAVAIALPLSGCVASHGSALPKVEGSLPSFKATFDYAFIDDDGTQHGTMSVETLAAAPVLDRLLSPEPANLLKIVWTVAEATSTELVAFDGDLDVVRTGIESSFKPGAVFADWTPQGGPLPLGIGLLARIHDGAVQYQLDGEAARAQVSVDGNLVGFVGNATFAQGTLDPDATYRFDNAWIPIQVHAPTHGPRHERSWLNRTAYNPGAPLPLAPAWKKEATNKKQVADWRYFPYPEEQTFHMGITFKDLGEALERLSPQAKQDLDDGCIAYADAYWGGGAKLGPPQVELYGSDQVAFQIGIRAGGTTIRYEVRYSAESGLLSVTNEPNRILGSDPYGMQTDQTGSSWPCMTKLVPSMGPIEAVRNAWVLPTPETGVPCDIGVGSGPFLHQRGGEVLAARPIFSSSLIRGPEQSNDPWDMDPARNGGSMGFDLETGMLSNLMVTEKDLAALDGGAAATSRALPPPGALDPAGQAYYRCVEPQPID